jgi:hypothetical protein
MHAHASFFFLICFALAVFLRLHSGLFFSFFGWLDGNETKKRWEGAMVGGGVERGRDSVHLLATGVYFIVFFSLWVWLVLCFHFHLALL